MQMTLSLAVVATLLALAVTLAVVVVNMFLKPFQGGRLLQFAWFIACGLWLVWGLFGSARAHDNNHWGNSDPAIRQWMQELKQPDNPSASCCGEADAYWADEIHIRDGKTYATITDDRPDAPLGRPHVDDGTEIEIPNNKLKHDRGNPTGHGVVFLSRQGFVFCYVQPGGA